MSIDNLALKPDTTANLQAREAKEARRKAEEERIRKLPWRPDMLDSFPRWTVHYTDHYTDSYTVPNLPKVHYTDDYDYDKDWG